MARAIGVARRILRSDPSSAKALVRAGKVLDELGRQREAADASGRALEHDPHAVEALNNLAIRLAEGDGDLEKAATLARAVENRPGTPWVLDTLPHIEAKRGRYEDALAAIRKAIDAAPEQPQWRLARAEVLLKAGRTRRAADAVDGLLHRHDLGNLPKKLRGRSSVSDAASGTALRTRSRKDNPRRTKIEDRRRDVKPCGKGPSTPVRQGRRSEPPPCGFPCLCHLHGGPARNTGVSPSTAAGLRPSPPDVV